MDERSGGQGIVLEVAEGKTATCRHHWIIDAPAGPVSKGVCRLCGLNGEFRNSTEGGYWEDSVPLEDVSTGTRYPSSMASDGMDDN